MSEPRFGCLVGREEHGLGHVDTTLTDGFAVDEQSDGASFGESASVVVEIGAHLMFARFHRLLGVNLEPLVGSFLVRPRWLSVLSRIQSKVGQGQLPGRELGDGAAILVSGAFLISPGFITDVLGSAC